MAEQTITTPAPSLAGTGCCGTAAPRSSGGGCCGTGVPGAGSGYALRSAGPGDLAAARRLLAGASLPLDGLESQFGEQYAVAVADDGAGLVGVGGLEVHGAGALLRSVAVDPAWRGRGIGAALTHDRIAYAAGRGIGAVYALTTTAETYFPRFGFVPVDRSQVLEEIRGSVEFASACPATAAVLRLELGAGSASAIRSAVRAAYAAAARRAAGPAGAAAPPNPVTSGLYDDSAAGAVPEAALRASLGCGNPTALAPLREGDVVLDLGSGGGIDVLLSARRVGASGRAYGLDMTDEMLELARANAREAGVANVEFLKGHIEEIPLPDASVDVIISNCVINLSADKPRVLREAFRVLKPGGRFAVSDVVVRGEVPDALRRSVELWIGCVAGALEEDEFARLLQEVGFEEVSIEPTRVYGADDARPFLAAAGLDDAAVEAVDGRFASAFVRATKPAV